MTDSATRTDQGGRLIESRPARLWLHQRGQCGDGGDGERATSSRSGAPLIVVPVDVEAVHVLDDVAVLDVVEMTIDHTHPLDRRVGEAAEIPVRTCSSGS